MRYSKIILLIVLISTAFIVACDQTSGNLVNQSNGNGGNNFGNGAGHGGTKLRVLPNYALSACLDTNTGKSYVDAQTMMAAGGSPGVAGYTWSSDFSTFPAGTTVLPLTGVFQGNGGSVVSGQYIVKVKVSDGSSTATGTAALTVITASSGVINGIPDPGCPFAILQQYPGGSFQLDDAVANKPYGATLFALGGTPPYFWSEDETYTERSDFDMSGLKIDSTKGIVSGTPFESASGKTLKFVVTLKDSTGETISGPVYMINVK